MRRRAIEAGRRDDPRQPGQRLRGVRRAGQIRQREDRPRRVEARLGVAAADARDPIALGRADVER